MLNYSSNSTRKTIKFTDISNLTIHRIHHAFFVSLITGSYSLVGNIPYDAKDEDLKETFKIAGPFDVFRLKVDQKTN